MCTSDQQGQMSKEHVNLRGTLVNVAAEPQKLLFTDTGEESFSADIDLNCPPIDSLRNGSSTIPIGAVPFPSQMVRHG